MLVAQRIIGYADVVGRQAVVPVDPKITWAKLAAMAEGAPAGQPATVKDRYP